MRVLPTRGEQLAVSPAFDDAAVVDHQDAIGSQNGAQTMDDEKRRPAGAEFFQRLLRTQLGGVVDGTGGCGRRVMKTANPADLYNMSSLNTMWRLNVMVARMTMAASYTERTLQLVRQAGVLRPRDLDQHETPRQYLRILEQAGVIHRAGRGLYTIEGQRVTENHTIAEACKRVPRAVVCLVSALRLHGLTTQMPHEVWMAMDRKARKPKVDHPPLRIVRFSGDSLTVGIQRRKIEGVEVRLYDAAKTVADCFKYRNKIGLDVALEALRDCRKQRKATVDDLWAAARVCRVANVMRPYMEAIG